MLSSKCLTAWFTVCHSLLSPQGTGYMAQVLQSQLCFDRPPAKAIQERQGPARRDGPQPPQGAVPCWQLQLNAHGEMLIDCFGLHFILIFVREKSSEKYISSEIYFLLKNQQASS